jgi:inner membrane protein
MHNPPPMDTITQGILGAAFGNACAGPKLGRRAAWWGAVGGALPDADLVVKLAGGDWAELAYHRSLTHALWFGPAVGSAIGYGVWRWYGRTYDAAAPNAAAHPGAPPMLREWILLFVITILTHPLLDWFTSYGTQLFWPFSSHRFALDAISIVDPIYTLILLGALLLGRRCAALLGRAYDARTHANVSAGAILITTGYLMYGWWLNGRAEDLARRDLEGLGVTNAQVHAYPTLLQLYLRRVVTRTPDVIRVGKLSTWAPRPVAWRTNLVPHHPLVDVVRATPRGRLFEWFAMGQTSARVLESEGKTVVAIEDVRYSPTTDGTEGMWWIHARFPPEGPPDEWIQYHERSLPPRILHESAVVLRDAFAPE